jgi:Astacin (Peptidase family M12A)
MRKNLKVCVDRVLPKDVGRPQQVTRTRGGPSRAVFEFKKMWINGSTLRVRFMGGTATQQALAKKQALWWVDHANLKFDFNNAADAEIRVTFDPNDGAWSYIGTDAKGIPLNQATLNLGFMDGGTAAHEFGHAIGLGHEHQNPQGGIQWNEAAVLKDLSGPPNNWSPDQIRFNVLNKYSADQIRGTQFDADSIMLYQFPASWTKNGMATHGNDILSAMDKAFIASEQAYPRIALSPVTLKINGVATSASIGVPGEEDVYTFTVPLRGMGRHVIETGGQTDVVMKLFGANSQTNLIAEDDDGGVGYNSRIATILGPGKYFVQIRHYNKANGTGSYTIKVTR